MSTTEGDVTWSGAKGDLIWSESECFDCSGCVAVCPFHALEARHGKIVASMERCTLCTMCVRVCPTAAFRIERAPKTTEG